MASQRQIVEKLFETALELEPASRSAYLSEVCGSDADLRQSVEDLLAADARAEGFLQNPPFAVYPLLDVLDKNLIGPRAVADSTTSPEKNEVGSASPVAGRLKPGRIL